MKWLVASDLHGSAVFTRALRQAFLREGADRLLLLGDLLYHGPRNDLPQGYDPKEVISILTELAASVVAVRGNCEAEVDQAVLPFPVLADYAMLCDHGRTIFATHGHVYSLQHLPPLKRGDVLLHGHTHVPACEEGVGGIWYLNPGSVSLPKQGSPPHSYMTFDAEGFCWKELAGGACFMQFPPHRADKRG